MQILCKSHFFKKQFQVYGSGYEVVVLDNHFNRVQILSLQDSSITSTVKCIACGTQEGKVCIVIKSFIKIDCTIVNQYLLQTPYFSLF